MISLAMRVAATALLGAVALGLRRSSRRRVASALELLRGGHARILLRSLRRRVLSRTTSIGLQHTLGGDTALPAPAIATPLVVRPLAPQDRLAMLDAAPGLPERSAWNRSVQRRLLAAGLPGCWVGVKPDGSICYMQWLITAKDEDRIRACWGDLFPRLAPDDALVEGIFTAEADRRQGIMAHAMARIALAAAGLGVRRVVVFVSDKNPASLKGCRNAGFVPFVKRSESWFLFRRRVRFRRMHT